MTTDVRYEPWPAWAKLILLALVILAVISALPWIFMWTGTGMNMMGSNVSGMASSCLAMCSPKRMNCCPPG